MIGRALIPAMAVVLLSAPVLHASPERSLFPVLRPGTEASARPDFLVIVSSRSGVVKSMRPVLRPRFARAQTTTARQHAEVPVKPIPAAGGRKGAICGKRSIRGENLATIPGKLRGCGVRNPVRVSSVAGVSLTRPSIMDCTTAKALNDWVENGVKPSVGRLGGGVASLEVIAGYSCRTRNNKPGAKISEHGKGRAIDIAGFNLNNGMSLDVLKGWPNRTQGKLLKRIHRAACGPFGTVLGPNSDRFHRNHFHLDTARYRGGSYCR